MKTMIDVDDEALELAARELGTTTKKDTVNAALEFVAAGGVGSSGCSMTRMPWESGRTYQPGYHAHGTALTVRPGPGHLYLIDTSAHARSRHAAIRDIIAGLLADRAAATCVTVDLEAGYSGRDLAGVRAIAQRRGELFVVLPVSEVIACRARGVQVRMAARGRHRAAGVTGLLTAAVAEHHGAVILHYDADFEHIAATTGQPHHWIVPPGSLP